VKKIFIVKQQIMAVKRHTFSHYHLDYVPLLIETDTPLNNIVTEAGQTAWYKAGQSEALGLAAPIKLLLQQIVKREDIDG
jgi:A/G-specific adenine glycosylase